MPYAETCDLRKKYKKKGKRFLKTPEKSINSERWSEFGWMVEYNESGACMC